MKRTVLKTIIFISSIPFFVGCADSAPQAENKLTKESLSVYNIMGIVEPERESRPLLVVKDNAYKNYNFITTKPVRQNSVSNNIEVVSYGSPREYNTQREQDTTTLINNIEWNAKSFLGTRYVWGATGPNKFDCSGFTQWVYRDAGINIPRVSRDQAKVGQYVSYENLQKGDMVFFDTKKRRAGIVTHVGIYLGNGNFIHASSSAKKVVVYNFNEKTYYKDRFLWGRRVVNNTHYASNSQPIYY
ncbi:putative secreted protein [hydrothermal vent metagenome]|uniref:Putative secreted protein n=1 Tax=hydrothermal vent metagenome TaxID=652676 RepID=A0A1W1BKA9_9ZZZZ